jgi:hypothetical protein
LFSWRLRPWWPDAVLAKRDVALAVPFRPGTYFVGVESVAGLARNLTPGGENWIATGRALGGAFPPHSSVVIATTAAGAIPYCADLTTVDMLGLNDRRAQREGEFHGDRPGHQRVATVRYLLERGVNLVLGHPWCDCEEHTRQSYHREELAGLFLGRLPRDVALVPNTSVIVAISIPQSCPVLALYLTPHAEVSQAIEDHGWRIHPLDPASH